LAHRIFLATITQDQEPATYVEVVRYSKCREAMQSEIQALETNSTWIVTPLSLEKKALGCK